MKRFYNKDMNKYYYQECQEEDRECYGVFSNKIIFTDGEASMPEKPIDAIWIVFGGTKINPRGGRVIDITEEQLQRLYSFEMDTPSKGRSR